MPNTIQNLRYKCRRSK